MHYSNKPQIGLRLRYRASGGGADRVSTARPWKNGKFEGPESLLRSGGIIRPADIDTGEPIEGGGEIEPGNGEEPPMFIGPGANERNFSMSDKGPGYR
jgi:hypothetical protein